MASIFPETRILSVLNSQGVATRKVLYQRLRVTTEKEASFDEVLWSLMKKGYVRRRLFSKMQFRITWKGRRQLRYLLKVEAHA